MNNKHEPVKTQKHCCGAHMKHGHAGHKHKYRHGDHVAIEAADIILVKSNPMDVAAIMGLAKATYGKMIQNLVWATGYNAFAIPAAAVVFAPWGVILSPAVGAIFMSASTVICAVNAKMLRLK